MTKTILRNSYPKKLANDLHEYFLEIKKDLSNKLFEKTAAGKFVETSVQILQFLENQEFDEEPKVDKYLRTLESSQTTLSDDLKLCMSRVLRSMYSLRNKRNIAHKNYIHPNEFDLKFLYGGAQWVYTEFVRLADDLSVEKAQQLVEEIQLPISDVIEIIEGKKIVLADSSAKQQILLLLQSVYPHSLSQEELQTSMDRLNPRTVSNNIRKLWNEKLIERVKKTSYKLTRKGVAEAKDLINSL